MTNRINKSIVAAISTSLIVLAITLVVRSQIKMHPHFPSMAFKQGEIEHNSGKAFAVDYYQWSDSNGLQRKMSLVKNDALDPTGNYGGYIRSFEYYAGKELRACTGSSNDDPGFGFLVNHYNNSQGDNHWITSLNFPGSYSYKFHGLHHAIHEYKWSMNIDGEPIEATVHWFLADGIDNPIFAITYDLSQAKPNSINADSRSPYGDLGWDGDKKSLVSGVAWGDRFKFKSTSKSLSLKSSWDYSEENLIPFAQMWSNSADAEMGIVQTQSWKQHDGGGYWFYNSWGQKSEGPMPEAWNWTYQLNQYQLDSDPTSKRLAWGSNYGALGQIEYNAYGDDKKLSGYPYQSYSTYVVLGKHSKSAVAQQVKQLENMLSVDIEGHNIEPVRAGYAGVGRTDKIEFHPRGWNHVYGVWELEQSRLGPFSFDFKINDGTILNPIFRVNLAQKSKIYSISLDGTILLPEKDYLVSMDDSSTVVWVTLIGKFSGSSRISAILQ